jgi:hypothetical protein
MATAQWKNKMIFSNKGQSLIELTFLTPLMLLLIFGVVEVGSVISTYLRLAQLTREGANLTSRGEDPNVALTAIIAAAAPLLRNNNLPQWRLIYTRIVQDPATPCNPPAQPCRYIVDTVKPPIIRGNYGQASKIGAAGSVVTLPGVETIGPNQRLHAIEVYYDYGPSVITSVGRMIPQGFYERTIFTDVSGKP